MKIFNINLSNIKKENLLKEITKFDKQNIVFTPNPEILLISKTDEQFKNFLEKADFLTIDWIGIYIWFQILENKKNIFLEILLLPYYFFNLFFRRKYLYKKFWERICWSDLTSDLVNYSEKNNIKITIIDPYYPLDLAKVESQKNFRKKMLEKFQNLDFDFFVYSPEKKDEIIEKIWKSESKILFSTLWMKKQEKSVIEILEKCENIKLWLGIWSSFDYFIGFQKRAPKFWRIIWLEWFYRIFTWPQKIKRLKRIYRAVFVFLWEVLKK